MANQFSFMLVGAGGMGSLHAQGLQSLGCELICVVDKDVAKAESLAMKLDAKRWSQDYSSEVRKDDIDFVVVATWPDSHAPLAIEALQAGKDVLCEKPIAHTLESARKMIGATRESDAQLFVGHCLRYDDVWKTIVADLHSGAIGKPMILRMTGNQMTFGSVWRAQQNLIKASSPLIDCGVHYVDLMRWIVQAEATEVFAMGARISEEIPEDRYNYGLLQVKFADGSIGHYEAGWGPMMTKNAWYVKDFSGPKGSYSVYYDLQPDLPDNPPKHLRYTLRLQQIPTHNPEWKSVKITEKVIEKDPAKNDLLKGEHLFFLESLQAGRDLSQQLIEAYKALEIVYAADESIRTEQIIHLDTKGL